MPSATSIPAVIQELRGNPSNRTLSTTQVRLIDPDAIPHPPDRLSVTAALLWTDTMRELALIGVISTLDSIGLELLCECFADWCQAAQDLADHGSNYYTVTDQQGNIRILVHPAVSVKQDADRRMRGWLSEFGMTPAARAKWKVPGYDPSDDENPLDLSSLSPRERDALREMLDRRKAV